MSSSLSLSNNGSHAFKGLLYAIITSILYGLVPTFFIPISEKTPSVGSDGMSDLTIVFYRFFLAAVFTGVFMLLTGKSFAIRWKDFFHLIYLALFRDGAALFLVAGYSYMTSGIATTLHFTYPVFTTLIMMTFYRESKRISTIIAVIMSVLGVSLLSWQDNTQIRWEGIALELLSALSFALYLIGINRPMIKKMDNLKIVFYVLLIGSLIFLAFSCLRHEFKWITTGEQAKNLFILAFFCTFITNFGLVAAIKLIGSTITSILGAIEPLTAVIMGCILFHESLTPLSIWGLLLILPAILIIIYDERPKKNKSNILST